MTGYKLGMYLNSLDVVLHDIEKIRQRGRLDCGVACLKILLGNKGIEVSYEEILDEMILTVEGILLGDVKRFCKKRGVVINVLSLDNLDSIKYSLRKAPVMVRETNDGWPHFKIVYGMKGSNYLVHDPVHSGEHDGWRTHKQLAKKMFRYSIEDPKKIEPANILYLL